MEKKEKIFGNKCLLGHAETVGQSVASDPQVLFPPTIPSPHSCCSKTQK